MSLRTTLLVSAIALAPMTASAEGPTAEECEVIKAVAGEDEDCAAFKLGDAGGVAGDVTVDGLGLPGVGSLGVTNFAPALLPILLGGAAVAAVALDGNGASNGTN